ncbi:MAG TPA: 4Fe-4S dicluster domain-containing protein [Bacteroidales bacterium]|nr:4Fe-4S dicluster domain-containing protein [Bacteroidales bacterium]
MFTDKLKQDVRFIEGLKACINCGTCTAICPAAQFYNYDPRQIADTVQNGNDTEIEQLLKSDTIWYCGECLSCKTRCPRDNTPGYIVQALRSLSIKEGYYLLSEKGRQQLEIKRRVGDIMLKYGYCVYVDEIETGYHPEQGPIWDWYRANTESILKKLGANYKGSGAGTLRKIDKADMDELHKIFEETGAMQQFNKLEDEGHE